jgi:hypothetical protein
MKIEELIQTLEVIKEVHGNLIVHMQKRVGSGPIKALMGIPIAVDVHKMPEGVVAIIRD